MFETVTKAKWERCFNSQEQNCQHQPISLALASTGGEMRAIFMSLKKMSGYCVEQRINIDTV